MPGRNKPLITRNGIPDPQAYNPQTGQWESFIGVSWGKTAGGLYVPIRVDDQGRQEVTLSGTIVKIFSYTLPVTAGGTITHLEITPPAGKKWTIQHWEMLLTPPSAATTGTQRLIIQLMEVGVGTVSLFTLSADYKDRMQYDSGMFSKDGSATPFSQGIRPSDPSVLANLLRGVEITSAVPLRFRYENNTDALQAGGTIKIAVIEEG